MSNQAPLRVAALVDLPLTPLSGGHARGWEKMAQAAAKSDLPLDLTVFFSGKERTEILSPHVRIRHLPPVFSTARLTFLPYVPDHTDLAKYHAVLARELKAFDVIHTTDGFFAFARTAEKICRKKGLPLVTSFHTDTPSYARVFARRTIESLFGKGYLSRLLTETLRYPERQEAGMNRRLKAHLQACRKAIATRKEDIALASSVLGSGNVSFMRTAVDREVFGPHRKNRTALEADYNIPANRVLCVFVGRLDEGKNIYVLIDAIEKLVREGLPVHLVTAGVGPAEKDLRARLGTHATVAGFVQPDELGRLYASADILAMPSEVEMRSLITIEAMASGLPVLLSEKGGVAANYGFPPAMKIVSGDGNGWAAALRELVCDEKMRAKLSQESLSFAKEGIPGWNELLAEDFWPVWQKAFQERRF